MTSEQLQTMRKLCEALRDSLFEIRKARHALEDACQRADRIACAAVNRLDAMLTVEQTLRQQEDDQ